MWNSLKAHGPRHAAAGALALATALAAAGCGTDDDKTIGKHTQTPATPPVVETAAAPTPAPTPAATPEPAREVTYEDAEAAFLAGRYGEAVDGFTSYTERRPDNPWGHYMRGLSAWKDGSLAIAESSFQQALALDPDHAKSRLNLARVLLDASRPAEAIATVDSVIARDPSSGDAYRLKGRACHTLGRVEEAATSYRKAIQLNPADAWAMNNLAYLRIEEGRFEEALPALARAVELRPDVAVFWNNLGMALERTGHARSAEQAYAAAVTADSTHEKAAVNCQRIAAVQEDASITPVDLTALARGFETEIEGWSVASE
jgi:Flp pilus assembly protein TadD